MGSRGAGAQKMQKSAIAAAIIISAILLERGIPMSNSYTERVDGIQIRDVTYLSDYEPENKPIQYDVVKWVTRTKPTEVTDLNTGKKKLSTEYCYSIATLIWDEDEEAFDINSIGLRLIEAKLTERAQDMILAFCALKEIELRKY